MEITQPVPTNIKEAVTTLERILQKSLVEIRNESESNFLAKSHMGVGMWIRNNWGLWTDSDLKQHLKQKGITHPDDMSMLILTTFHRKVCGNEIKIPEQIKEIVG